MHCKIMMPTEGFHNILCASNYIKPYKVKLIHSDRNQTGGSLEEGLIRRNRKKKCRKGLENTLGVVDFSFCFLSCWGLNPGGVCEKLHPSFLFIL